MPQDVVSPSKGRRLTRIDGPGPVVGAHDPALAGTRNQDDDGRDDTGQRNVIICNPTPSENVGGGGPKKGGRDPHRLHASGVVVELIYRVFLVRR